MSRWNSYKNKTVLITGASSGIGLAMAKNLANQGAKLILVARSTDKLNATVQELKATGTEAFAFTCDLGVEGAAHKLYHEVLRAGLSVDLLVNNAGYGRWGKFTDFDLSDYAKMIQLNITTLTELCHLFIADMVKKGMGGIINVGSTASFAPVPYGNVYSSTKAYVLMFSEALHYEYADNGIQIMALCPGATESQFMAVATEKSTETRKRANERKDSIPFQTSEEVAQECFQAFLKNKPYHIAGKRNRRMYAISKHLSRKTVLNMVGKMFQKVAGS